MLKTYVIDLNALLVKARDAYYKKAAPIMTDAEYDAKEKELADIVAANPSLAEFAPVLTTVGSDLVTGRVKHIRPMLSIENKYDKDEIVTFFHSLPAGTTMLLEPKRDGISVELRYRGTKLVQALSRGTGTEGEDMTAQVMCVAAIPKTVPAVFGDVEIRGELVMRKSELERINVEAAKVGGKQHMSTRNLTAGTMKQRDLTVVAKREILFIPWELHGNSPTLPDSAYQRMLWLRKAGFPQYEGFYIDAEMVNPAIIKCLDHILAENRKSDIAADGVVAKVDSHKIRKELGVGSKFTKYQICFKPQSAAGTTYLRNVVWQIGRLGKLTPVAECDPVPLAGAMVTRASLNNSTWIATMGLKLGAKVEMLRSGDVIPQITKVIDEGDDPIVPPTKCPNCGGAIEVYGEDNITTHWCTNDVCPGRVTDLFAFIGGREILEIDGLGPEMARKLVVDGYARDLGELFAFQAESKAALDKLGEEKFAAAMGKKGFSVTIVKMIQSMENAKIAPWDRWLPAMGIPMIGRTLSKPIVTALGFESDDMAKLPKKLEKFADDGFVVDGIGPNKRQMIVDWACSKRSLRICTDLYDAGVRPTALAVAATVGDSLKGVAFCITGEFGEDRDSLYRKLESLGGVGKSGVSKKVTLLIVGEGAGKTKLAKATELGIKQVGKEWLEKTLADNGMKLNSGVAVEEA
jgi:DNA ligase (NAD+)